MSTGWAQLADLEREIRGRRKPAILTPRCELRTRSAYGERIPGYSPIWTRRAARRANTAAAAAGSLGVYLWRRVRWWRWSPIDDEEMFR